jgi:putative transposase
MIGWRWPERNGGERLARIARVVVTGLPHHITQRGNRREPVFFAADDDRLYRLIATAAGRAGAAVWACCLMPNGEDRLRATFAEVHRRYTGAINARFHSTGYLFQGEDDELATGAPLRALIRDFAGFLAAPADPVATARIERAPTIGRPLGAPEWIAMLERRLGRTNNPCERNHRPVVSRSSR